MTAMEKVYGQMGKSTDVLAMKLSRWWCDDARASNSGGRSVEANIRIQIELGVCERLVRD
jgi:hypothetical protein